MRRCHQVLVRAQIVLAARGGETGKQEGAVLHLGAHQLECRHLQGRFQRLGGFSVILCDERLSTFLDEIQHLLRRALRSGRLLRRRLRRR